MASPCEMPAGVRGFISFHFPRERKISQARQRLFHILRQQNISPKLFPSVRIYLSKTQIHLFRTVLSDRIALFVGMGICEGGFERRLLASVQWTLATPCAEGTHGGTNCNVCGFSKNSSHFYAVHPICLDFFFEIYYVIE